MKLKNIPFLKIYSIKNTILAIGVLTISIFFSCLVFANQYFDCDMRDADPIHDMTLSVPSEKQYDSWSEDKKRKSKIYQSGFIHVGLFRAPDRFVQILKIVPYDQHQYMVYSFNTKQQQVTRFYAYYLKAGKANPYHTRFDAFEFLTPPDDPEYVEREAFVNGIWDCKRVNYLEYLKKSSYLFLLNIIP